MGQPYPGARDWAAMFRTWYIFGFALGVINFVILTGDVIAKLKKNGKAHGVCNLIGCCAFVLAILHWIWIGGLRYSDNGKLVSGDFLDGEPPDGNYLIAHGKFALIYFWLTAGALTLFCCILTCTMCYITAMV